MPTHDGSAHEATQPPPVSPWPGPETAKTMPRAITRTRASALP